MVARRELITICRQIGTMMEVGVDFLRITRALRDQTDNPRLVELYEQFDHDMKMGESLSDAMSKAPDVFSPFAVSLIRQGEARGDIEGAWHRLADFYKQEAQEDKELGEEGSELGAGYIPTRGLPSHGLSVVAPRAPVTVGMLSDLIDRVQNGALRALTWVSALLICLAISSALVTAKVLESQWLGVLQLGTAALFLAGAGSWLRSRLERDRRKQVQCSFCGKFESTDNPLQRSPRLAGAAICAQCAANIAGESRTQTPVPVASGNGLAPTGIAYMNGHPNGNPNGNLNGNLNGGPPEDDYDPNSPVTLDNDDPLA